MLKVSAPSDIPTRLYRAEQVRELDRILIEDKGIPGLTLMRRAASACCDVLLEKWPAPHSVRVYCGSGNNAADGYIVAGMLAERSIPTEVVVVGDSNKLGEDGRAAYAFCSKSGAKILQPSEPMVTPELIVDALLGTGVNGAPRPEYERAINEINDFDCPVLSVDVPSGLNVDTGAVIEVAVKADVTVTFIGLKRGLFTGAGVDHVGHIHFADLGCDPNLQPPGSVTERLDLSSLRAQLRPRPNNAHKYRFGHVLVIGGDLGMGGAPLMSALAAMRVGAGLVTLATREAQANILMAQRPELMVRGTETSDALEPLLEKASLIVLGPGLGAGAWGKAMFERVMKTDLPLVVDADGLNLLAKQPVKKTNWILTPHPGEAGRLLDDRQVEADRFLTVKRLQESYGGVAILKGAGSLIADDGDNIGLCPYGNSGMSTAGMGDVLAGVIGGVYAQVPDAAFAARLGVALHSAAGDICAERSGKRGIMATDLIPVVRELINDR